MMLIIVNCWALYSCPWISYLLSDLQPTENKVAVCGMLSDYDSGKIEAAKATFRAIDYEICQDNNLRSHVAMLRLLMNRHQADIGEFLLVSDIPADQEAAIAVGIEFIQPELFDVVYKGLSGG